MKIVIGTSLDIIGIEVSFSFNTMRDGVLDKLIYHSSSMFRLKSSFKRKYTKLQIIKGEMRIHHYEMGQIARCTLLVFER